MNQTKELFKYHVRVYMNSNKLIMPFLVWIICMFTMYSILPVSIVSNFILSMTFLFYLMVWIGIVYTEIEDPIAEQLLILKVKNINSYYISKILLVIMLGIVMSIFGVLFPLLVNVISGFRVFTRAITFADVVCIIILHIFGAMLGGMTGMLFHPRIIKERKLAVLYAFAVALLGIIKGPLNDKIYFMRFITWIFPPLCDVVNLFSKDEYFLLKDIGVAIFYMSSYTFVIIFLQMYLLKKNKF